MESLLYEDKEINFYFAYVRCKPTSKDSIWQSFPGLLMFTFKGIIHLHAFIRTKIKYDIKKSVNEL